MSRCVTLLSFAQREEVKKCASSMRSWPVFTRVHSWKTQELSFLRLEVLRIRMRVSKRVHPSSSPFSKDVDSEKPLTVAEKARKEKGPQRYTEFLYDTASQDESSH
jgi:hypothetical protein